MSIVGQIHNDWSESVWIKRIYVEVSTSTHWLRKLQRGPTKLHVVFGDFQIVFSFISFKKSLEMLFTTSLKFYHHKRNLWNKTFPNFFLKRISCEHFNFVSGAFIINRVSSLPRPDNSHSYSLFIISIPCCFHSRSECVSKKADEYRTVTKKSFCPVKHKIFNRQCFTVMHQWSPTEIELFYLHGFERTAILQYGKKNFSTICCSLRTHILWNQAVWKRVNNSIKLLISFATAKSNKLSPLVACRVLSVPQIDVAPNGRRLWIWLKVKCWNVKEMPLKLLNEPKLIASRWIPFNGIIICW